MSIRSFVASLLRPLTVSARPHSTIPSISPSASSSSSFSNPSSATMTAAAGDFRLPTNVKPLHYDLTIQTSLQNRSFVGSGSILLKVLEPKLTHLTFNVHPNLNVHSLSLQSTSLKTETLQKIPNSALVRDDKLERVTVNIDQALGYKEGDEIRLNLGWGAKLGKSMTGYYQSTYTAKETGKEAIYALTQFEPTDARAAFPCWDEPLLKATYALTMISDADTVNLSNMPVISEQPYTPSAAVEEIGKNVLKTLKSEELKTEQKTEIKTEQKSELKTEQKSELKTEQKTELKTEQKSELKTKGSSAPVSDTKWKITKFETTPLMSTYLLTFANGPFEYREDSYVSPLTGKTVPLRIYATSDIVHQVEYALEVTKRAVPLYEEIFDIPFALPKLDSLVASDFDAGAMEGWGLITGRTSVLLFDAKSGLSAQKRVATVQSHEIAHQWFGDLVTMEWWEQLWLNEAFATLMGEVIVPDRLYPEWKVRTSFITGHLFPALSLDAQRSSHAIEVVCPDANKINEIFDGISYSKGASVLRMLSSIVGEETFLKGVSLYLKEKSYGNGNTRDLWNGISKASGLDIAKIADSWTLKIGFPIVTVKEIDGKLELRQDRFLATGDVTEEENKTLWHIPLGLLTVGADGKATVNSKAVLSERETTVDLKGANLYKLNSGTTGVYRVAYSAEHLEKLGKEAAKKNSALSAEDRVGLVSDAHRLSRAGYSPSTGMLGFISELGGEDTEVVWDAIATALDDLTSVWWEQPESVREGILALKRSLFGPLIDRLGFEFPSTDSPSIRALRTNAFYTAGSAGYQPVIEHAQKTFAKFASGDEEAIEPDLRGSIFGLVVKNGNRQDWEKVREVYKKPANPSTKIAAMLALTRTLDPELIQATLDMMAGKEVQDQDFMYFCSGLSANLSARRTFTAWFKENYDMIFNRFEGASLTLGRLIKFQSCLTSQKDRDEIKAFYATKDTSKYEMALAQTLEAIDASARWVERDAAVVQGWLKGREL